jgi:hypothetical protein
MREASYYAKITKYYERTATNTVCWEAKFTRTHRLSFDALAPHQEANLLKSEEVHGHKIADSGIGVKPYDGYVVYRATAVVLAIYYRAGETDVYEIPIRKFVQEKYESNEKSLTKERATFIGKRIEL